ncbi:MAG: DNA-binding response regulator [Myxococcaceae bacterium]|nr:MAG: DNA-binding response regulator [Myxococcaceae bacterium]
MATAAAHGFLPAPVVWVVDDDRGVSMALFRLLRAAALEVVLMRSGRELLERLAGSVPDCLLLDLWLEDATGLELLPRFQLRAGQVPVVFLSAGCDVRTSVEAMKHGAVDFLEKPVDEGALLDAVIRAVARGRAWREARAVRESASRRLATLTPREREVFSQVALGKPNKRIAAELGTTEKTIKVHRGRVMQKLEASSVVDLVRLAQQVGQVAA